MKKFITLFLALALSMTLAAGCGESLDGETAVGPGEIIAMDPSEAPSETPSEEPSPTPVTISNTAFVIYISGIDSREGLVDSSTSDVNIMAAVNTDTRQALLLTTPRDYYIPLSISDGQRDKLTHAGFYGVQVGMDSLSMLYEVPVDYYFRLDFEGFIEFIDALGGVTVWSDYAFTSKNVEGYTYVEGENQLDGESALAFCRERYSFQDGDIQRGRNQLAVLRGIIDKLMSPAVLTGYQGILDAMAGNFETSIPASLMAEIALTQLDSDGSWNIVSASVNGTGAMAVTYTQKVEASVVIPDENSVAEAKILLSDVLNGEIITQPEPETLG